MPDASPPSRLLDSKQSLLLIVDVQEKFIPIIPDYDGFISKILTLIETAKLLQIPIVVSEQYKKGLGETVDALRQALPETVRVFEKTTFSCLGAEKPFVEPWLSENRKQVIVCGFETHVCVNQTTHQLLEQGFQVHLIEDAIQSRVDENKRIALQKMYQSGAIPSSVEIALFELLRDAKHPKFKEILSLVK